MIKKRTFYSLNILLPLGILFPVHSSPIDDLLEKAFAEGVEFIENEVAREKQKRHNQAVRILTKISNKHKDDFECINEETDKDKRLCFAFALYKKKVNDLACYFEQIKEHRAKTESAEFDLDEHEKINPELNAQLINEKMNRLQAVYKRVFNDEILEGKNKEKCKCNQSDTKVIIRRNNGVVNRGTIIIEK